MAAIINEEEKGVKKLKKGKWCQRQKKEMKKMKGKKREEMKKNKIRKKTRIKRGKKESGIKS